MPTRWRSRPVVSPRVVGSVHGCAGAGSRAMIQGRAGLPAVTTARRGSTNYRVTGVTVDATNTPIAGMSVYLMRAGSMELVDQGTSDGSGAYVLTSPTNAGTFVVASFHPDGSLAGITRPVLEAV